jgi:hypothetical protein
MKYNHTTTHSFTYSFKTGSNTSWELEQKISKALGKSAEMVSISEDSDSIDIVAHKDISKKVQAVSKKIEKWIEEIADANYEEEKTKRAKVNEWLKNFTPIPLPHPSKSLIVIINEHYQDVVRNRRNPEMAWRAMVDCKEFIQLHNLLVKKDYRKAEKFIEDMDTATRDVIPDDVLTLCGLEAWIEEPFNPPRSSCLRPSDE